MTSRKSMRIRDHACKVTVLTEDRHFVTSLLDTWNTISEAITNTCYRKNLESTANYIFGITNLDTNETCYYKLDKDLKPRKFLYWINFEKQ